MDAGLFVNRILLVCDAPQMRIRVAAADFPDAAEVPAVEGGLGLELGFTLVAALRAHLGSGTAGERVTAAAEGIAGLDDGRRRHTAEGVVQVAGGGVGQCHRADTVAVGNDGGFVGKFTDDAAEVGFTGDGGLAREVAVAQGTRVVDVPHDTADTHGGRGH